MNPISQRTAKLSLLFNVILIIVSIGLFILSVMQRIEAESRRIESEMQRQFAEKQLELAEMRKLQADSAAFLTLEQAYRISVLEDSIAKMKPIKKSK